jgi:hypothetical protein
VGDQTLHPGNLIGELVGPDGVAVRQIDRGDANFAKGGLYIAGLLIRLVAGQAADKLLGRPFRQQRHPVIGALSDRFDMIAEPLEFERREIGSRAFRLLQAQDVRLGFFEKCQQMRQPSLDRINVPTGNLHGRNLCSASADGKGITAAAR